MVLFKGANALIHDCTLGYTDGKGFNGHSTISEAVRIAELSEIPVLYPFICRRKMLKGPLVWQVKQPT